MSVNYTTVLIHGFKLDLVPQPIQRESYNPRTGDFEGYKEKTVIIPCLGGVHITLAEDICYCSQIEGLEVFASGYETEDYFIGVSKGYVNDGKWSTELDATHLPVEVARVARKYNIEPSRFLVMNAG